MATTAAAAGADGNWVDLLASRSVASMVRHQAQCALPEPLARALRAGQLADADLWAALLLLQACWTGRAMAAIETPAGVVSAAVPEMAGAEAWRPWREQLRPQRHADSPGLLPYVIGSADVGQPVARPLEVSWAENAAVRVTADAALADEVACAALAGAIVQALERLARPEAGPSGGTGGNGVPALRGPELPAEAEATVVQAFARQAASRGARPAIVDGEVTLSYADLDRRSAAVASTLQTLGAGPGRVVGLALERSVEGIVALLGILKTGAAYLPLDTAQPPERVQAMLRQAGVVTVVTRPALRELLGGGVPWIDVGQALDGTAAFSAPDLQPNDLAYVMFTSGSTGEPKGIAIRHRSILRLVLQAEYASLDAHSVVLHAAPLGFDASTLEIWGALLNGGCCVVHDEALPTAVGLGRTIRTRGVNTAWLTSALFNAVVDADVTQLRGLRQLLVGGEALSVAHVRRAQQALEGCTLINGYGPTECTTFTTCHRIEPLDASATRVPIGRPITDTVCRVLGPTLQPVPDGLVGELFVGGSGLARGYLGRPDLDAERFLADPHGLPGDRLYRTGDRVRVLPGGVLDYIGRYDGQIKLRGLRIELGEIEAALARHPGVRACAVAARATAGGGPRLVGYVVPLADNVPAPELRDHLASRVPGYMVPAAWVTLSALPVTINGKLDRHALPNPASTRPELSQPFRAPQGTREQRVCEAFALALGVDPVGRDDNFFELGGNSLLSVQVLGALERSGTGTLTVAQFFAEPTPAALARALSGAQSPTAAGAVPSPAAAIAEPVAIVAMAGRFPGAATVEQLWEALLAGRDGITHFAPGTLDPSIPSHLAADPSYVAARGVVDGVELFDAAFFGISPGEAAAMDPQQRIFLELCWECLERAGHAPDRNEAPVGVFAGMHNATYFQRHLSRRPEVAERLGDFAVMLANEKDYLATRVAHRLDLTGPAVSVNTACSTSLVAVAQAFAALRAGQCDLALAGGVSITCPPRSGYLYDEGAMLSPDGATRSFDARGQGTVFSDGAAVVALKRLSDALADGNPIHAVVRAVSVNNDGRRKASFTAPSVEGQARVIAAAQAAAGVDARSIGYVEAHGTATPLGDPVEVAALTQAFRRHTPEVGFCRLGSVKSNLGHLVMAAGATGLIKTALALEHEQLPPNAHFEQPNPKIDFAGSPFVVAERLQPWPRGAEPRRAGVSSFGVGGTNAHAIVEEAPWREPSEPSAGPQWLMLSARTPTALARMADDLAAHLEAAPQTNLADVAHTLDVGRSRFDHRLAVVARRPADAAAALRLADSPWRASGRVGAAEPPLVWMFPGQGAQYPRMGLELARADEAFAAAWAEVLQVMQPHLAFDLAARLAADDPAALTATATTQPATFCLQVALGRAWLARGLRPAALVGHSVGEFAAAVLAGVMSLADAARLVALRGALMDALPAGAMLAVRWPAARVQALLPPSLALAAENGPSSCVVAGPEPDVLAWRQAREAEGAVVRRLQTSHAFHSPMMDPVRAPFEAAVASCTLAAPRVPLASTLSGKWLEPQQAANPGYWSRHLRETVRFSAAVKTVQARFPGATWVELGPRDGLCTLVRQHPQDGQVPHAAPTLGATAAEEADRWLLAQARLWARGHGATAHPAQPAQGRRRLRLPTYSFDRVRHWIDAPVAESSPLPLRSDMTSATAAAPAARHPRLVTQLQELFADVAGFDLAGTSAAAQFVELGLDSLTLTQAAIQVKKAFGVPVTFRQLMESYRSFGALAEFLDGALPPEAPPAAAAPPAAPLPTATMAMPVSVPMALPMAAPVPAMLAAGAQPVLQQLIAQQMTLMSQQLALLSGASATLAVPQPQGMPAVAQVAAAAPAPTPSAPAAAAPEAADGGPVRYDVKKAFGAIARIHTQAADMTERQRLRLEAFVRRYTERTRKSKEYTVAHRDHLADPRVVNGFRPMTKEIVYQVVVERSKGSRLWDLDGNEYVDVLNGFGMNLFGWQPDFVQDAVRRQLDLGYEIGPQHPLAGDVARLVCELTGFDRAGLCNTGSEAVMAAIRMARTVTGRSKLVLFTGSYHGTFDEVVVRAGRGGKGIPAAPGIMAGAFGDVQVLDYGTPEALEYIRQNADDLAAVLVEAVQSRRPDFQPREFLQEVRAITQASGSCLIFDEVITGFRAHPGGVQAMFGIRADLATYGKVIGGGFPVGVVAGKREFMDALDGGAWRFGDASMPTVGVTYFAGTFVRHPLALAAAKASLEHLKAHSPQLQDTLNLHTAALADELTAHCREVGAPVSIRYFASLWRVTWLEDHPLQDLLFAMMRGRGVHILDNFPCFLTTAHNAEDIALIKTAFKESIAELQEAEFLPRKAQPAPGADPSRPPVPNARLGRDKDGKPTWFVPDPKTPGKYVRVEV